MGTKVSMPYAPDKTRDAVFQNVDTSLSAFFERPIVARTYTWTPLQVGAFTAIFDPWNDFFANSRVINRINNYNLLRSKLHVRFMINGNGFYYGRLMADYLPLPNADRVTSASTLVTENAVQASQRMKVFIDPATCCSNELELPFVYWKDGVSIPTAEWTNLGKIYVRELQGLKHANASTQPLTITVMMWATDVQMSIPTSVSSSALVPQAGDEYASAGPVEMTATAIASMAGAVTDVPGIGPFARATELAAKATSKAASVMGWSRPAEIAPAKDMRPKFVSDLAPSGAGDNVSKLSLDIKQEVTIDPNVIGVALPDEMSVASIAARESYLTQFPWATSKVGGDLLFTTRVKPFVGLTSGSTRYLTASAFAVWPFSFWRGKMRYRLQIVGSAYHKGRLRIVWDPQYIQSLEGNVQFTRIVDISEERDVTFEIDWGNPQHFLPVETSIGNLSTDFRTTPQWPSASAQANGVFSVYVLNDLATPNSSVNNDIAINFFVSCNDLQVAAPRSTPVLANSYAATVQAGDVEMTGDGSEPGCGPATADHVISSDADDADDMLVYFGERIVSFRQLLKRYNLHSSFYVGTSSTVPSVWAPVFSDTPFYYGYNNLALHTTSAAGKFSYVNNTLLQYLSLAFVASRGSLRSKYVATPAPTNSIISMTVLRSYGSTAVVPPTVSALNMFDQSFYARSVLPLRGNDMAGAATTTPQQQPFLEVEHPYYKPVRFDTVRDVAQDTATASTPSPFANTHTVELFLGAGTGYVNLSRYVGVGEDFSLMWFQGCPPLSGLTAPA